MKKLISSLMVFVFVPFGSKVFASDCSEEFTEGVQQCNEVFPPDNAILMAVNSLCILVEGAGWVVCKIGEML